MTRKPLPKKRFSTHKLLHTQTMMVQEDSCKFTDKKGRIWDCSLTMAGATRVDSSDFSALGVQEFSILIPEREMLKELITNKSLAYAVIWAIVYPQAEQYIQQGTFQTPYELDEIDSSTRAEALQSEFLEGIDGSILNRGMEALVNSLGNFIPEIKNVLSAFMKQAEKGRERLRQEVEKLIPQIQEASDQALENSVKTLKAEAAKVLAERPGTLSGG